MRYEMYQPLPNGTKRLISIFDSETDQVTMIHDAKPVVMTRNQPQLRTSVQPKAERPPVIRTMAEAKREVLAVMTEGVPAPPSLDAIVTRQRELGLRP